MQEKELCQCKKAALRWCMISDVATPANSFAEDMERLLNSVEKTLQKPCTCQEKKEEPKQECDHILGIIMWTMEGFYDQVVKQSDDNIDIESLLEHAKLDHEETINNYCPKCGAPIDWEKIKESLKQSNEKE